ncbi:MAG: chromosome segregation protein SMC [Pseudomonadota bacterium]
MKFVNLRLVGFKSFVETTDFEIRDGLTGVVGPNGCGKSNLLEALRWVMGATSAKALRGDGMASVVFSGTSMRPARNWAEVTLTLDNSDRSAPAEYNETATIEVSRRIIRKDDGASSVYRINAKEVRAKDVQLLFADAASGANSPSLVRQGQVADLINANPQNRRRLLEDAAGVAGLHTRRHEAELRLRAAETNLERLDDVAGELETRKAALARQARQAVRYRNLSGDIRRAEAMAAFLRWRGAQDAMDGARAELAEVEDLVGEAVRTAAAASASQARAHEALEPLRIKEAEAAAGLHRLTVAKETLDADAARAQAEVERLRDALERLAGDDARERELSQDAQEALAALDSEEAGLKTRETSEAARLEDAAARLREAEADLADAEGALETQTAHAAEIDARRRAAEKSLTDSRARRDALGRRVAEKESERAAARLSDEEHSALATARTDVATAEAARLEAENALAGAREAKDAARAQEAAARPAREKAERRHAELRAECEALQRLLDAGGGDAEGAALIETVDVAAGYENAFAAALGDDLDAVVDNDAAARHWSRAGAAPVVDAPGLLPTGVRPLADFVTAPPALARRLSAIGVAGPDDAAALQPTLAPGVRLVSADGGLWRWDGFVSRPEAKTSAAIRLEQRNRLQTLVVDLQAADAHADETRRAHDAVRAGAEESETLERAASDALAAAGRALDAARDRSSRLETARERAASKLEAVSTALAALVHDAEDATQAATDAEAALTALPDADAAMAGLGAARERVGAARGVAGEARAAHNDLAREAAMRASRFEAIARERGVWTNRAQTAQARLAEVGARRAETESALNAAAAAPDEIETRRVSLLDALGDAEHARNAAADALQAAQNAAADADRTLKDAETQAAEAREARARIGAQVENANARVEEALADATEIAEGGPDALLDVAEHKTDKALPTRDDVDRKLERYKRERENLGGVNLQADEELRELAERLDELTAEREDCEGAIRKLRAAIGGLNREARQRLHDAFETVSTNFSRLFTRLFNGGEAELRLIDSEDVLDAGLEILASPPGKKLTSISLMSGGEQALTATALIFAVFMANPAPVCVLDEVDAPLDDANTERFCLLLSEMARETQTRFIVITHHALTMSRMDRLFGVTMIERGVSQLVSVDLQRAAQLAAE